MSPVPSGTCYGFSITSSVELHLLRTGPGESPLVVDEWTCAPRPMSSQLLEWDLGGKHAGFVRLYGERDRYALQIGDDAWYEVDPTSSRIAIPPSPNGLVREERLWGLPALLCFLQRGDASLHAAAVEVGSSAIAIGAPGRWGKTTLAAAFLSHGFRVLSEDLTCCRPGPPWMLYPGPAILKVRRDVFEHLELRHARVGAEDAERVHLRIDDELRGSGAPVPLGHIVVLAAGESCSLERIRPADAIRLLWPLSFNLPTDDDRARCFRVITDLVASTPVWRFRRPVRYDCLGATVEFLAERLGS